MIQAYITHSPEETQAVARKFSGQLKAGDTVALMGDLGTGKTCFAKGVVASLSKVDIDTVTSPSFTLIEEYEAPCKLYHVDLYRLEDPKEAQELPWDDLFATNSITLIEWPEKVEHIFSHCKYRITFIKTEGVERRIEIDDIS